MMDFKEVRKPYTQEEAINEAKRCLNCPNPLCKNSCPAHLKNNEWIHELSLGNINEAYKIIMEDSNLSSICSRVCDHFKQCRGNCILNKMNKEPINIGNLERYVMDNTNIKENREEFTNYSVALIGSGPSSLSCARELVKNGIHATIYEKENVLGGLLRFGIPEYRLPRDILDKEIDTLRELGVEFKVGETHSIEELKKMGYSKVFIACGLSNDKKLNILSEDANGVYYSLSFLKSVNLGENVSLTGTTLVIGGGNVAMDASRCALRVGAKEAIIVYRRSLEEAPASKEEINEAISEGVIFKCLYKPVEVITRSNKVVALRCEKMVLGEVDESGRRSPIGTGEFEDIPCDNIIIAIGESPDDEYTSSLSLESDHGYIVASDDVNTSDSFVYVGGDIVRGASTVVEAMLDGKKAALKIIEDLKK